MPLAVLAIVALLVLAPAATAGEINGTVTKPDGSPAALIFVELHKATPGLPMVSQLQTGADGRFAFGGLPDGSYKLRYRPRSDLNLLGEWYVDRPTAATATWVNVQGSSTVTADAQLRAGAVITGQAKDAGGGPAKESVLVYASRVSDGASVNTHSNTDGTYRLVALPPGSWRVTFVGRYYFQTILDDPLALAEGQEVAGIDAELTQGGRIEGRVRSPHLDWLDGVRVEVYDSAGDLVMTDETANAGRYDLDLLEVGTYKLKFIPPPGSYALGQSRNGVAVKAGVTTAAANETLAEGGAVTGRVRTDTGAPLRNAKVYLIREDGLRAGPFLTDAGGDYRAGGLRPGRWKVFFGSPLTAYLSAYYDAKPTLADADFVTVTELATVTGVNAALARRP